MIVGKLNNTESTIIATLDVDSDPQPEETLG